MLVRDLISKIIDSYQKITISEYSKIQPTGRKWIIESHVTDYTNIPEEIWNTEIDVIGVYCSGISICVQKKGE